MNVTLEYEYEYEYKYEYEYEYEYQYQYQYENENEYEYEYENFFIIVILVPYMIYILSPTDVMEKGLLYIGMILQQQARIKNNEFLQFLVKLGQE